MIADINEKALTFINRESYLKRNYLGEPELQYEKAIMTGILREDLLINLRTYDKHSFVLYANDHQNNFVHLYVTNSNEVVYLFNYNHTIVNLTIAYNELNSGKSIQIAVKRTLTTTTLHVNEMNVTVDKGILLLDTYSNKPWENPEIGKPLINIFLPVPNTQIRKYKKIMINLQRCYPHIAHLPHPLTTSNLTLVDMMGQICCGPVRKKTSCWDMLAA